MAPGGPSPSPGYEGEVGGVGASIDPPDTATIGLGPDVSGSGVAILAIALAAAALSIMILVFVRREMTAVDA
jgi:hypothetical protein